MKTYKLLFKTLLTITLGFSASSLVFAQKITLPLGLTEKSSLEEILNWLDQTSLPQAHIGLEANFDGPGYDDVATTLTQYDERAFFSKGFRLAKIDGCKLTLRNDNLELISFETRYPDPAEGSLTEFRKIHNNQSPLTGEFSIPLQTLKAEKAPFRHTKKEEKAALLGTWRTEFKRKWRSDFFLIPSKKKIKSLLENQMKIEIIGVGQNGRNDSMNGDELTFTFDDKQISENFYAAFSRVITLCKDD